MSAVAEVPVPNAVPGATYAPRPALAQRWNALDRGQRLRWGALAANLPTRGLTLDALLVAINGGQEPSP